MAKFRTDEVANTGTGTLADPFTDGYWWSGLIPATEPVTMLLPSKTSMHEEEIMLDPFELWNEKLESGIQVFVAKARQFNALTVRGWHFHARSQSAVGRGTQIDRTDYPGQVAWLPGDTARKIVRACFRSLIRWTQGLANAHKPNAKVVVVDMDSAKRPEGMTEPEFLKYEANVNQATANRTGVWNSAFNPSTDRLVADFVYFHRLNVDPSSVDLMDYERNPNKYNVRMVPTTFTRAFFSDPPKSVAEMYPQEKA